MDTQKQKRSAFSGKIGFVLSAAGASVGLGNIWRFPYLAAKYGGGIFLLVYIVLAVTFGYTMIVAETALGRMTHKSPVGAFGAFGKKGGLRFGGWINAVIPILIKIAQGVEQEDEQRASSLLAELIGSVGQQLATQGSNAGVMDQQQVAEMKQLVNAFVSQVSKHFGDSGNPQAAPQLDSEQPQQPMMQ